MLKIYLTFLAAAALAAAAHAQNIPRIGYVYPAGGQQGTTVQVRLGGQGLDDVNAALITTLMADGVIPVIAPTGVGDGGETYNINADLVAGAVARAMEAAKLILLTDVAGVLDDHQQLVSTLNRQQAQEMIDSGIITGGMLPKINCCLDAVAHGVGKAHILDGRMLHAVLLEIFTTHGIGTEIVG